ncbi:hypothetical protein PGB28_20225 [Primorskyibacter aestuariivivens]|uniref:hypothetical protein n=1 Tax=Primorskyibacter aestuariivivens TaxID=1888912 RepID=UPI0022FFFEB6|nr:hypothetical protein [Primorskyibacter aestuariivivens]MDA7430795.1 hypothetical protein [Primorskyibacter aestuariivivens]
MGKLVHDIGYGTGTFTRRVALNRELRTKLLLKSSQERAKIVEKCADHRLGLMAIRGDLDSAMGKGSPLPGIGGTFRTTKGAREIGAKPGQSGLFGEGP